MSLDSTHVDNDEDNDIHAHRFHFQHGEVPIAVCPKCHSLHIETRNRARKIGGAVGAVSGATSAILAATLNARAAAGLAGGPVGMVFSGIASAVLGALVSSAASGTTGVKLGEIVDEKILNNYLCHACGHTFSLKRS